MTKEKKIRKIEEIRNELTRIRDKVDDLKSERLSYAHGALTTLIVALYSDIEEIRESL